MKSWGILQKSRQRWGSCYLRWRGSFQSTLVNGEHLKLLGWMCIRHRPTAAVGQVHWSMRRIVLRTLWQGHEHIHIQVDCLNGRETCSFETDRTSFLPRIISVGLVLNTLHFLTGLCSLVTGASSRRREKPTQTDRERLNDS